MPRGALLLPLALPVVLLGSSLSGCGLLDGSSSLEDALETLPSGVTRVTFDDREDTNGPAVEWEVVGVDGDRTGRVQKLEDDIDLDELDPDLTVVRDERLVVSGDLTDDILDAVHDDTDSLVDSEAFEDLVDSTDDIEYAVLARSDSVCGLDDPQVTPELAGLFVHGDDATATSALLLGSEDDADAVAEVAEANDLHAEVDGDRVLADIGSDAEVVSRLIRRSDYAGVCPAGG